VGVDHIVAHHAAVFAAQQNIYPNLDANSDIMQSWSKVSTQLQAGWNLRLTDAESNISNDITALRLVIVYKYRLNEQHPEYIT
jgi:hypothetical protein